MGIVTKSHNLKFVRGNYYNMKAKASKNRKKGWRKVDISEVEDFLEDQNLQERTGLVKTTIINNKLVTNNRDWSSLSKKFLVLCTNSLPASPGSVTNDNIHTFIIEDRSHDLVRSRSSL